jgi:hypothetical protein
LIRETDQATRKTAQTDLPGLPPDQRIPHLLRKGSIQEIDDAVRNVLHTVRGRSHFILGTTDYFNENTPKDKIQALADSGRRYGKL